MKRKTRAPLRRAYSLVVVLVVSFLVLAMATILGGLVILEWGRDRHARLDAHAREAFGAARAWSHMHAGELNPAEPTVLPVEELLPEGSSGELTLRIVKSGAGHALVACEISLQGGGRRLTRKAVWPLEPRQTTGFR